MPTLAELIGNHPNAKNQFGKWLSYEDKPTTPTKKHRALHPLLPSNDPALVAWLGRKIFDHHHSAYRIQKLNENYTKLGFKEYASYLEQHRKLPRVDKVQKGNGTEILLTEYVEACLDRELLKVFKLRYNPNVDQAIKGDDTLMVDLPPATSPKVRVYLGEAKFRAKPDKAVVETISQSLAKDKKPLSYSFLVEQLAQDETKRHLADLLDDFIIDEIKNRGDLIYTGFLLSDAKTSQTVETHLCCDNPQMILISLGIANPQELIQNAFAFAESLTQNPELV